MNATAKTDKCAECVHAECRKDYGRGPWDNEPDRVEFEHAGLHCLLHRSWLGFWCGYVGVEKNHPFYGVSRHDLPNLSVHGGKVTYTDACEGAICHVPKPGESEHLWWIGFDCGCGFDLIPRLHRDLQTRIRPTYRDLKYVREQTERLANQIASVQG